MSIEYYKRYRPKTLQGVIGQDAAIASLQDRVTKGTLPHTLLLTGGAGVGKTTIARVVKNLLKCGKQDFVEINCADFKGIDMVRDIRRTMGLSPLTGLVRVWLIDECHMLTKDAQNAFLKLLEDTPDHVYFMLATTDPQKLIATIHSRSTEVKLSSLSEAALIKVIRRVTGKEDLKVSDEVVKEIAETADGSARKALVILEQVGSLAGDEAQLAAIQATTFNKDLAIGLARALINPRVRWDEVAKILRDLKDEPEGIRYLILGYARSVMLKGGPLAGRAFMIIDIFSANFYDSKLAGLAAACWEVVHPMK